jgi:amino acid efflux transporter
MAVVITLGTTNAYIAATSRLGYALARDGSFPDWLADLDARGVPLRAVLIVGGYAAVGMVVTYLAGWSASDLLIVPVSLALATYVIGTAAGVLLLSGTGRSLAGVSCALCLIIFAFAGGSVVLPVGVALATLVYRGWRGRTRRGEIINEPGD